MPVKSDDEKLLALAEKIKKLEAQKKEIENRAKQKERKERTRKLIQIGAILNSMGIKDLETAERFKNYFMDNPKSKDWLEKFLNNEGINKEN